VTSAAGCRSRAGLPAGSSAIEAPSVGALGSVWRASSWTVISLLEGPSRPGAVRRLIPAAPCTLDRLVEDPLRSGRCGILDDLELGVRTLVADGVHQLRGLEDEQAQLLRAYPRPRVNR
jgi:hypothetical protein